MIKINFIPFNNFSLSINPGNHSQSFRSSSSSSFLLFPLSASTSSPHRKLLARLPSLSAEGSSPTPPELRPRLRCNHAWVTRASLTPPHWYYAAVGTPAAAASSVTVHLRHHRSPDLGRLLPDPLSSLPSPPLQSLLLHRTQETPSPPNLISKKDLDLMGTTKILICVINR